MPEGDALFRFAARLRKPLEGEVIRAARSHGPGPVPRVEKIVGQRCTGVRSSGKNLLISFENGLALRGHLRMYGTWHIYEHGQAWRRPEREARLVLETDDAVVVNFSAPVIELVNNILAQAMDQRASDIHIEPEETLFHVRMRVDGILHTRMTLPAGRYPAVASREHGLNAGQGRILVPHVDPDRTQRPPDALDAALDQSGRRLGLPLEGALRIWYVRRLTDRDPGTTVVPLRLRQHVLT